MELFGTAIGGVAMFTLIIMSLVAIILVARSRLVSSGMSPFVLMTILTMTW